jgi:hypothetical protein
MARKVVTAPPIRPGRIGNTGWLRSSALDLALLVDAQDQRMLGGRHVEPDNIAHLLHEQGIGRKLEAFRAVRLQAKGFPDAMDVGTS